MSPLAPLSSASMQLIPSLSNMVSGQIQTFPATFSQAEAPLNAATQEPLNRKDAGNVTLGVQRVPCVTKVTGPQAAAP